MTELSTVASRRRLRISRLALLTGSTLLALVMAEALVRTLGVQVADDPFIAFGRIPPFFETVVVDGQPHLQIANAELYRGQVPSFPVAKAKGVFRIFCVGGSASAGWPHPPSQAYSALLRDALQRAYPDRPIEVINVSAHAYAAYRVRMVFQQIINLDPDLVIVYSGSNEFLERRTYGSADAWYLPIARVASNSTAYRLLRGGGLGRLLFPQNTLTPNQRDDVAYEIWSKIERLALDLRRDPVQLAGVTRHYAFSITSMVEAAHARGVAVILIAEPVNLRDWRPNVSYQALQGAALINWDAYFRRGRAALLRGDAAEAVRLLERAVALNPGHGDAHYFLGQAQELALRYPEALHSFGLARDNDFNPFRTLSSFNTILRTIAAAHENVTLADADAAFRRASAPRAPGFDLFLDYVHPTAAGNDVLARLLFDVITSRQLIGPVPTETAYMPGQSLDTLALADANDAHMQMELINLSMMMHQYERALDLVTNVQTAIGTKLKRGDREFIDIALELLPRAIALERREIVGPAPSAEEWNRLNQRLHERYESAWGLFDEFRRNIARD